MKVIALKTINYLDWKGIVLRPDRSYIEATEENVEKLHRYINSGHLEIIDLEQVKEEEIIVSEPAIMLQDEFEKNESLYGVETVIQRIHEYTKDELKAMNRAELIAICEERNLTIKKNFSVAKIEETILKNQ